jgi:hypothetical protein
MGDATTLAKSLVDGAIPICILDRTENIFCLGIYPKYVTGIFSVLILFRSLSFKGPAPAR